MTSPQGNIGFLSMNPSAGREQQLIGYIVLEAISSIQKPEGYDADPAPEHSPELLAQWESRHESLDDPLWDYWTAKCFIEDLEPIRTKRHTLNFNDLLVECGVQDPEHLRKAILREPQAFAKAAKTLLKTMRSGHSLQKTGRAEEETEEPEPYQILPGPAYVGHSMGF